MFSEPGTPDVENLYARSADGPSPSGLRRPYRRGAARRHRRMDARPLRGAVVQDGELYGRGAVDMKGGIACMIAAALVISRGQAGFLPARSAS